MSEVITASEVTRELSNAILLCLKYLKQTGSPSMLQPALPFDEAFSVKKMLNVNDVAEILQVSSSHAYALIRRGEIPSIHIGRSIRVRPADLEEYLVANIR